VLRTFGEVRNMLLIGRLLALAAGWRRESRGAHFRCDHPAPAEMWAHRQILTIDDLLGSNTVAQPVVTAL
jgi:L-aspartate oxidase